MLIQCLHINVCVWAMSIVAATQHCLAGRSTSHPRPAKLLIFENNVPPRVAFMRFWWRKFSTAPRSSTPSASWMLGMRPPNLLGSANWATLTPPHSNSSRCPYHAVVHFALGLDVNRPPHSDRGRHFSPIALLWVVLFVSLCLTCYSPTWQSRSSSIAECRPSVGGGGTTTSTMIN